MDLVTNAIHQACIQRISGGVLETPEGEIHIKVHWEEKWGRVDWKEGESDRHLFFIHPEHIRDYVLSLEKK